MGLYRAGFDPVGIDHRPQPRYPFEFILGDALEYAAEHGHEFDMINASPPCQGYIPCRHLPQCQDRDYPLLIEPTRELLVSSGKPFLLENPVGAPLFKSVVLCGLMFGLKVFRHRIFESNVGLMQMSHPSHNGHRIGQDGFCCVAGHGDAGRGRIDAYHRRLSTWETAMGIDWMLKRELTQAIPPAYLHYLGLQMMRHITSSARRERGLCCEPL
jgi:DNA (cytosine-5)-methyltransferase 1